MSEVKLIEKTDNGQERKQGFWRRWLLVASVFVVAVVLTEVLIWISSPKMKNDSIVLSEQKSEVFESMEKDEEEDCATSIICETSDQETRLTDGRIPRNIICLVRDEIPPDLKMVGAEFKSILIGANYEDEGAVANDNCDGNVTIKVIGNADSSMAGTYEIKFSAQDTAGNISEKTRIVRVIDAVDGERIVYLTFDDGPSGHTGRLLDVLKKYDVKATFFVTGYGDDDLIRREYEEGHTVALHTNSHNYEYLYSSDAAYFEDLYAVRDRVERITGVAPRLIRFPGGSSNVISAKYNEGIMSRLVDEVTVRGFSYADWNVSSGDAGGAMDSDAVYNNVISRFEDGQYVVLQHDTKGFSVDAVERIIQFGLENGYTFMAMDENSFLAHHMVNN